MNDDQLYYFLVDKNTRNVLQIEYPSDIDEFNKILGTSEGKGSLLKDLGIILSSETKVFTNPEPVLKQINNIVPVIIDDGPVLTAKEPVPVEKITKSRKKPTEKSATKKIAIVGAGKLAMPNLFDGLFD